ncbi:MAG: thymidine phosphorylase [Clostridia bacterium]|nr:thymidine phosphorylase [Clostridia bacterium]
MRIYDIIKKKRDGYELTTEEINFFISGYVSGEITDYQASALLMAIYFKGMTLTETTALTLAVKNSGDTLDFKGVKGIRADKHSTGGVGDKTSLCVMPIVASLGLKVAKMSGRGLGHTGGTVDKLESIPNFKVDLKASDFENIVNEVGVAIIGQTNDIAPADKKLYALRDVTATVDSIPLIASSIMGKKLAVADDVIVLDVKTGSGSFMKSVSESENLAKVMVGIGKNAGKKICALITNMDAPLGNSIGNSLEVIEAVNLLKGSYQSDFYEIVTELATEILTLSGLYSYNQAKSEVKRVIDDGTALNTFKNMVKAQGGDVSVVDDVNNFKKAKYSIEVVSESEGYIYSVDTEKYGLSALTLGAGRNKITDVIDYSAGIILCKKTGNYVHKGDVIATLYTNNKNALKSAKQILLSATKISTEKPQINNIIIKKVY